MAIYTTPDSYTKFLIHSEGTDGSFTGWDGTQTFTIVNKNIALCSTVGDCNYMGCSHGKTCHHNENLCVGIPTTVPIAKSPLSHICI